MLSTSTLEVRHLNFNNRFCNQIENIFSIPKALEICISNCIEHAISKGIAIPIKFKNSHQFQTVDKFQKLATKKSSAFVF